MTVATEPRPFNREAAILARVIDPDSPTLSADAARSILAIGFSEADLARMNALADAGRRRSLSAEESEEYDAYLFVGRFLALVQAKARLSLRQLSSASA